MTDCKSEPYNFQANGRRRVVSAFNGGNVTSDAGGLLLREVVRGSGIIERFAQCFTDHRAPGRIEHTVRDLLAQRIVGIALGYEDLNDHDRIRHDPLLATLVDKPDVTSERGCALAGKSTLNRLELTPADAGPESRYAKVVYHSAAIEHFFIDWFIDRHKKAPAEIILDVDATDDPTHGNQEGSYFHGYYDHYCYLPLYIFCGDDLLSARLRTSDCDPTEGVLPDLCRIVNKIRKSWPGTRIIVRGDSGFCREDLQFIDFAFKN